MDLSVCCIVQTTVGGEADAEAIARSLLEKRLAACVQIFPVASHYVWKGAMEKSTEWTLIVSGDPAYIRWIGEQTSR
jgi:periplasmic divalent cation tolerance protein